VPVSFCDTILVYGGYVKVAQFEMLINSKIDDQTLAIQAICLIDKLSVKAALCISYLLQ
jgi:hypothetical protein